MSIVQAKLAELFRSQWPLYEHERRYKAMRDAGPELHEALTKCLARLIAHPDRTTLDIEAIDVANAALARTGVTLNG